MFEGVAGDAHQKESLEIEQLLGDLGRVLAKFDKFSVTTFQETHPRKVYRDISNSILGERVFKLISQLEREDPGRYTRLMNVLLDAGPALEAAVDLETRKPWSASPPSSTGSNSASGPGASDWAHLAESTRGVPDPRSFAASNSAGPSRDTSRRGPWFSWTVMVVRLSALRF